MIAIQPVWTREKTCQPPSFHRQACFCRLCAIKPFSPWSRPSLMFRRGLDGVGLDLAQMLSAAPTGAYQAWALWG